MPTIRTLPVPDAMPVLSRGRHRRPRHGACLMEYVSVLAGERFSDAPRCTDPTLAAVARSVNDYSSDESRQRLALLASDISVTAPADIAAQQAMARRCLLTAIRYAVGTRRQVLIVAVLGLERAAAGRTKGFSDEMVSLDTELALLGCDRELVAARRQVATLPVGLRQYHRRGVATAVEMAIATIADEARNPDDVLYDLLVDCVSDGRQTVPTRTRVSR